MGNIRVVIRNPYHEVNLRMRSKAGKIWIVTVDNSFPPEWANAAPSGVIET